MKDSKDKKPITLRITATQRQRLDVLTSYMAVTASSLFGDKIDSQWEQAIKDGRLQNWLNVLAGGAPEDELAKPAIAKM